MGANCAVTLSFRILLVTSKCNIVFLDPLSIIRLAQKPFRYKGVVDPILNMHLWLVGISQIGFSDQRQKYLAMNCAVDGVLKRWFRFNWFKAVIGKDLYL